MRIFLVSGWVVVVFLVSNLCCVFMNNASAQDTDDLRRQVEQMEKQVE